MIAANPTRSLYPASTDLGRSERTRSASPWAESVILSAAKDPGLIASAPVSELRVRRLPRPGRGVSRFSSPNLDVLDAASTISPLSATLTKNTRGGGISQASANNSNRNPSPSNFKLSTACPDSRRVNLFPPTSPRIGRDNRKSFIRNAYKKWGEWPPRQTRNPMKHFCPERPSGAKDLSPNPTKDVCHEAATGGADSLTVQRSTHILPMRGLR